MYYGCLSVFNIQLAAHNIKILLRALTAAETPALLNAESPDPNAHISQPFSLAYQPHLNADKRSPR